MNIEAHSPVMSWVGFVVSFVLVALLFAKNSILRRLKNNNKELMCLIFDRIYRIVISLCIVLFSLNLIASKYTVFLSQTAVHKIVYNLTVIFFGLLFYRIIQIADEMMQRRHRLASVHAVQSRQLYTHYRYITLFLQIILVVLILALILMSFDKVRQIGLSLIASAGVAGAVMLIGLKSTFESFFDGIKLALAKTIRIGDSLEIDGHVCTVINITLSHVVLSTWEDKRIIVPVNYFLTHVFINRSYQNAKLSGDIAFYADHSAAIEDIRRVVHAYLQSHPVWDKRLFKLEVIEATKEGIKCRIKMSAKNADNLARLRYDTLEFVVDWLQNHHPEHLPRQRLTIDAKD